MKAKKLTALLLAIGMATTALAGCSNDPAASAPASAPAESQTESTGGDDSGTASEDGGSQGLTEASGAVKMLVNVTGGKDDNEMTLFAEALGEATGLEVSMEKPADYGQTLIQKLQAGEQYDLVYVDHNQYNNLVDQGALMDITDFINNSPIFSDPEQIDPQELEDIKVDGKIYAGFNKKEVHRVVGLNRNHLEAAGIEDYKSIDPTLDGYYEVLKALKESNSDSNYYPMDIVLSEAWDPQPWMAAAGLKGGVVTDEADGKTYVPYASDEAAPVWEWFHKLYAEGLLDPSCAVDKTTDMRGKMGAASQLTSCTVDWAAWIGLHNANAAAEGISTDEYEIVSLPGVKTPDGSYMLGKGNASLFAIPVNAPNPDGGKKILEYFATQEGGILLSLGIEDYDYTVTDGKYELTEVGKGHGSDHGAPIPIFKGFENPVGYNLGVEEALSYGEYAAIEAPIPNNADYKEIVGKWGVQIAKGDVSVSDGLAQMRSELVARGVCEK